MDSKNTYLITQPIFGVREENGKKLINLSSVINYGEERADGLIYFKTNYGEKKQTIEQFESTSIRLFKLEDICLDNFMNKWKRVNNDYKPIVLDETIETNEIFVDQFSPLEIMIERRKDCNAIKPLFKK